VELFVKALLRANLNLNSTLISISAVLFCAAWSAPAQALQWTLSDQSQPDSVIARSVNAFATDVTQSTKGSLALLVAPAPGLTSEKLLAELAAGRMAIATLPLSAFEGSDPVLAMDRVPYLASNYVDGAKLWQVLQPYVRDMLKSRGITLLYAIPLPPPAPLSVKSLTRLDMWRGSTIVRDAPAIAGLARALGARDVAPAAPRKMFSEGSAQVVFQSAALSAHDKAWQYATHYLHATAWFPKQLVMLSNRKLATLRAAQRDMLLNAADAAQLQAWELSQQMTKDSVQKIRDYGIKTREPDVNVLIQLEAIGRQLLFQWSDNAGEAGAQLVEAYYEIR
jgi:TRAP-type C4-dicarboxylate transport system substrate-binding protein